MKMNYERQLGDETLLQAWQRVTIKERNQQGSENVWVVGIKAIVSQVLNQTMRSAIRHHI
jgi:hypothetical protein